jgi:hypothetical protein
VQLTHEQYDMIERAVAQGTRIAVRRRGRREVVVIPLTLRTAGRRELIDAKNPTTGHDMAIYVDEIDDVEEVG